jgi:hypothetical protein
MTILPPIRILRIVIIAILLYAMNIERIDRPNIHTGIQSVESANIHDLLIIMISVAHSVLSFPMIEVSPDMLNDLNSQV